MNLSDHIFEQLIHRDHATVFENQANANLRLIRGFCRRSLKTVNGKLGLQLSSVKLA